jgi:hypothetical protein
MRVSSGAVAPRAAKCLRIPLMLTAGNHATEIRRVPAKLQVNPALVHCGPSWNNGMQWILALHVLIIRTDHPVRRQ